MLSAEDTKKLGKYELLEEIGHGGMATVYRAHDPRLGREVAIKVIHRHLRENKEVAARFTSEARAVAKVRHPNIVEVYDVSAETDAERFLVVELVRGRTLRQVLEDTGHWPAEVAAALGIEVAAGLEHAHEHGVIHRDVKPENVLVQLPSVSRPASRGSQDRANPTDFACIKITDFGIAKLLDAQGVTSTGQVLGSPAHMAPEQIEGGEVSPRADVFGLGVLLYECMVGELPFTGKNPAQVLRRVLEGTIVLPVRARPTIGDSMSLIISRALAREPEDRFRDCGEFAAALNAELLRLGFVNPRAELAAFLSEPALYREAYDERIVGAVLGEGRRARSQKDVILAAACFNRALAFRPDDRAIVEEVAGLRRGLQIKRWLGRAGMIGGAVALVLVVGVVAKDHWPFGLPWEARPKVAAPPAVPVEASPKAPDVTTETVSPAATKKTPTARRPKRGRPQATPDEPLPATRPVRLVVRGPQNARVKVDGQERENWFGSLQELTLGPHFFEFVPPDNRCCRGTVPQTVTVVAGEGPQTVVGHIELKPAQLELIGPPGTELTCGELGAFSTPGYHTIALSAARVTAKCTLLQPKDSGVAPRTSNVTFTAGLTVRVPETATQ